MRVEPFNVGQPNEMFFHLAQFLARIVHDITDLEVVMDGERRKEARRPAGWQDMIRTCNIVCNRWGSVPPQEQCPCVTDFLEIVEWFIDREGQMFRSNLVGHINSLVHCGDDEGY